MLYSCQRLYCPGLRRGSASQNLKRVSVPSATWFSASRDRPLQAQPGALTSQRLERRAREIGSLHFESS